MLRVSRKTGGMVPHHSNQGMPRRGSDTDALRPLAVTVEEGARMLGVGRATLYRIVMRGDIESFTVGRARRIAVSALDDFVHARPGA